MEVCAAAAAILDSGRAIKPTIKVGQQAKFRQGREMVSSPFQIGRGGPPLLTPLPETMMRRGGIEEVLFSQGALRMEVGKSDLETDFLCAIVILLLVAKSASHHMGEREGGRTLSASSCNYYTTSTVAASTALLLVYTLVHP